MIWQRDTPPQPDRMTIESQSQLPGQAQKPGFRRRSIGFKPIRRGGFRVDLLSRFGNVFV
jgi:hypothetical protein